MKKLIFLIVFLIPLIGFSQTAVTESKVINKYGATADTLIKDGTKSTTYYVKPFSSDAEIFWNIDSVAGRTKVTLLFAGSYDHSEWIDIDETTLTVTSGDTTFVQSSGTYLYPYLKAQVTAVDSVQTTRYKYNLVIQKGQ